MSCGGSDAGSDAVSGSKSNNLQRRERAPKNPKPQIQTHSNAVRAKAKAKAKAKTAHQLDLTTPRSTSPALLQRSCVCFEAGFGDAKSSAHTLCSSASSWSSVGNFVVAVLAMAKTGRRRIGQDDDDDEDDDDDDDAVVVDAAAFAAAAALAASVSQLAIKRLFAVWFGPRVEKT